MKKNNGEIFLLDSEGEKMKWHKGKVRNLSNTGNACYMNFTMECM